MQISDIVTNRREPAKSEYSRTSWERSDKEVLAWRIAAFSAGKDG